MAVMSKTQNDSIFKALADIAAIIKEGKARSITVTAIHDSGAMYHHFAYADHGEGIHLLGAGAMFQQKQTMHICKEIAVMEVPVR